MKEIIPSFKDSLIQDSVSLIKDYLEAGIDSVFEEGTLRDIPIMGTLIGVKRTVENVRNRNLLKNLYVFICEINSTNVNKDKLEKYRKKVDADSKFAEKELGRVLILLDRYIDNNKVSILGKLFKAYINEKISWNEFIDYSEMLGNLFLTDIILLQKAANKEITKTDPSNRFRFERLGAIGLVLLSVETAFTYGRLMLTDKYITVTEFGSKFVEIINII